MSMQELQKQTDANISAKADCHPSGWPVQAP